MRRATQKGRLTLSSVLGYLTTENGIEAITEDSPRELLLRVIAEQMKTIDESREIANKIRELNREQL